MLAAKLTPEQLTSFQTGKVIPDIDPATNKVIMLLNLLADVKKQQFDAMIEEVCFEAGDVIFAEGDPGDACYLIHSGRLAVIVGPLDAPSALLYRGGGDVIGEMALLENKPRSATVAALSGVRLLRIDKAAFDRLIESDSVLSHNLLTAMSKRLRTAHVLNKGNTQKRRSLSQQLSKLEEKTEFLEQMQQVRQETSDLIIHDLRNPLANLFGTLKMLEIVLPPEIKAENQDLLEIATLAYTRMKRLVDSLLDMRGIETGERELQKTASNLSYLVDETISLSQYVIDKRGIRLKLNYPERMPIIFVDEDLMRRVLANLIDNALKHLPEGGLLTITLTHLGAFLQVAIMDNGPGIPVKLREQIFEPFIQLERSGYERRGYGLGLRFVKQAIDAHNGRIWVESGKNDVGSCFKFELPLNSEE
jgi:signal transduction histidine kinase